MSAKLLEVDLLLACSKKSFPDVKHISFKEEGHRSDVHSTIFQKLHSHTSE